MSLSQTLGTTFRTSLKSIRIARVFYQCIFLQSNWSHPHCTVSRRARRFCTTAALSIHLRAQTTGTHQQTGHAFEWRASGRTMHSSVTVSSQLTPAPGVGAILHRPSVTVTCNRRDVPVAFVTSRAKASLSDDVRRGLRD